MKDVEGATEVNTGSSEEKFLTLKILQIEQWNILILCIKMIYIRMMIQNIVILIKV